MKQLLRIGEFAALTRVSVKALRYYESEGLLEPDFVDPDSGYRYFRVEQCSRLALITNLRAAGFPISEIATLTGHDRDPAKILDLAASRHELLLRERREVDAKIAVLETLRKSVTSAAEDPLSAVKLTSVAAELVHAVRARVPALGEPVTQIFESAETAVAAVGARAPTAPFLVFHDPPSQASDLDIEVCIPLTEPGSERIESCVTAAHDEALSVVYAGDYAQTAALRDTMLAWIDGADLRAAGPLREVFHRFGADEEGYRLPAALTTGDRNAYITELLLPVAGTNR